MDKLSANNVSFFQRPSYFNDSNLFKLEKISLSNQNDSRRNATKILFRKRDGNIWIVVVDKPYDKVKEYLERAVKNRRLSALKKALIQLKVKNLSQALINNSKVCFYNHQVKFFTKNRKIILKLLKLAMLSSNSLALERLVYQCRPQASFRDDDP